MSNNPESGPESGEAPVEERLLERVEYVKEDVARCADKVFREGGEEAAANFCATIEHVCRLMGTDLPEGVSRKDYVRGAWYAERALVTGIIHGGSGNENTERKKAVAEDAFLQSERSLYPKFPSSDMLNLASAIRKAMKGRFGGNIGNQGSFNSRDSSL